MSTTCSTVEAVSSWCCLTQSSLLNGIFRCPSTRHEWLSVQWAKAFDSGYTMTMCIRLALRRRCVRVRNVARYCARGAARTGALTSGGAALSARSAQKPRARSTAARASSSTGTLAWYVCYIYSYDSDCSPLYSTLSLTGSIYTRTTIQMSCFVHYIYVCIHTTSSAVRILMIIRVIQ